MASKESDYSILKRVAEEESYDFDKLINLWTIESSRGTDPNWDKGAYIGHFQFGTLAAKDVGFNLSDAYDLEKSARAAIKLNKKNTKDMPKSSRILKSLGIDNDGDEKGLVDYIAHQQGRNGMLDIISATKSGRFGNVSTRSNIFDNLGLSDSQKKEMDIIGPPTVQDNKNLAKNYLNFWKERYKEKKVNAEQWKKSQVKNNDTSFFFPDKNVMNEAIG